MAFSITSAVEPAVVQVMLCKGEANVMKADIKDTK